MFWFRWPTKFFLVWFQLRWLLEFCSFDAACQKLWYIDRNASDIRESEIDTALRTSPLLLDNLKPHVISLSVAGMLNIDGKRLNIWINMHILCWHSHMEVHCIVPIGFAVKTSLSLCFCPFHFAVRQLLAASSLLRRINTNEPMWVFSGSFFPVKFTWKQFYWFLRPDKCAVKLSLYSHLEPHTPYLCWCTLPELDGGSCLFISTQVVREISL